MASGQPSIAGEDLLVIFAKLFYSVPTIPPHRVEVGTHSIILCEPLDGILWISDILRRETRREYVLQHRLEECLAVWYPPRSYRRKSKYTFSKSILKLVEAGFLVSEKNEENRRQHKLRFTPDGEQLLLDIQRERVFVLDKLVEQLPPEQLYGLKQMLIPLADTAWQFVQAEGKRIYRAE